MAAVLATRICTAEPHGHPGRIKTMSPFYGRFNTKSSIPVSPVLIRLRNTCVVYFAYDWGYIDFYSAIPEIRELILDQAGTISSLITPVSVYHI
jgi:hypothetical protein